MHNLDAQKLCQHFIIDKECKFCDLLKCQFLRLDHQLTGEVDELEEAVVVVEDELEQSSLGCFVRLCNNTARGRHLHSSRDRPSLGLRYCTMVEEASTRSQLQH
jgi:hypothetical protein